jgi:hypothetical protein
VSLALAAAAAGCARGARPSAGASTDPAVVIFSNQSLQEADVYAVPRSGTRVRIGTVQAGRTDTLTVGGSALAGGAVTIVASLLAVGSAPRTGPVTLLPGDRIAVTLPPSMNSLSVLPAPR